MPGAPRETPAEELFNAKMKALKILSGELQKEVETGCPSFARTKRLCDEILDISRYLYGGEWKC